jgi:hypothetical protein
LVFLEGDILVAWPPAGGNFSILFCATFKYLGEKKERFALNKGFNSSSLLMDPVLNDGSVKMCGCISDISETSVLPSSK